MKSKPAAEAAADPAFEAAKRIAATGDAEARRQLAADEGTAPELLYFFANDEAPAVRRAVARNRATPVQADGVLAADGDDAVRGVVARKIGQHLHDVPDGADAKVVDKVNGVLDVLVADQQSAIRAIIAEEVKSLPNVPRGVVNKLARDAEAVVCAPVLEDSPLLENEDLIAIIKEGAADTAVTAIARRENLHGTVADAVVGTGSEHAVKALLDNHTAEIYDDTMDTITEMAPQFESWHQSLVNRPNLPEKTVRKVAGFVSASMVEDLIGRYPLKDEVKARLRAAVAARVASAKLDAEPTVQNPEAAPIRVLLADDDPKMLALMSQLLTGLQPMVINTVTDGEAALRFIDPDGPGADLIICDWMMPGLSGLQVLEQIRHRGSEVPFVMVTAKDDDESKGQAASLGATAYIPKPFTGQDFQKHVGSVIG